VPFTNEAGRVKRVKIGPRKVPAPGIAPARVLSLGGRWLDGQVSRHSRFMVFEPPKAMAAGMSGSPVVDAAGAAIGVVSIGGAGSSGMCPVIMDTLAAWLVQSLRPQRGRARPPAPATTPPHRRLDGAQRMVRQ
jgi:hypothetical protein